MTFENVNNNKENVSNCEIMDLLVIACYLKALLRKGGVSDF